MRGDLLPWHRTVYSIRQTQDLLSQLFLGSQVRTWTQHVYALEDSPSPLSGLLRDIVEAVGVGIIARSHMLCPPICKADFAHSFGDRSRLLGDPQTAISNARKPAALRIADDLAASRSIK